MSTPTTVLIVDDELQSRVLLRTLLEQFFSDRFRILEAEETGEAARLLRDQPVDILFLDVQMRGETGFDLLNRLSNWAGSIIFVTAHSDFAVRAFRYSALDYLLKPIDSGEFRDAVNKALQHSGNKEGHLSGQLDLLLDQLKNSTRVPDKLMVPTAEGIHFIHKPDILYCHAISNYTEFRLTGNRKITSSHTLGYYSDLLLAPAFFRIHRSYLVNISHIRMYKRGDGGTVIMNDGEEIEVSRNNKESFLQLFKTRK